MTKLQAFLGVLATALAALLTVAPAHALPLKTWVAGNGVDVSGSSCSYAQPCRTLFFAYLQTAPGGEVGIIGPGDYGTMLISSAISITNDGGGEAGILAVNSQVGGSPSSAVYVDAGSNAVQLRGLTIDGAATADNEIGIAFASGASLYVQNCVIKNFRNGGFGIVGGPGTAATLVVSDTTAANNAQGIYLTGPSSGTTNVALERVIVDGSNLYGIIVTGKAAAT